MICAPRKLDTAYKWIHTAVAVLKPGVSLPLDMLRYEQCWPQRQEDVVNAADTHFADADGTARRIQLQKYGWRKTDAWEPNRWRSFGVTLIVNESA